LTAVAARKRSGMRAGAARDRAIDSAFAVADRLGRFGAVPFTSRARRLAARLIGDWYSIDLDGATLGGSLADHGTYLHFLAMSHPFQRKLFASAIEPGMLVVDCGAHIGLHTVIGGRRAGPDGQVIAVEPAPPNLEALRANIAANGLGDRVELIEAAASNRSGVASLPLHTALDETGLLEVEGRLRHRVEVRQISVDEVLQGRSVNVAKVDVEGAEALVLEGMRETIERSPGMTVFLECHPPRLRRDGHDPVRWLAALRQAGTLELIDEDREELCPAEDEEIGRLVREAAAFNLRWIVDRG
jgi:FkbM family methyltransferase